MLLSDTTTAAIAGPPGKKQSTQTKHTALVLASSLQKNRPKSPSTPNLNPRFPEHEITRLSLGESTRIRNSRTSRQQARLPETSPQSSPDRNSLSEKIGSLGHPARQEWPTRTLAKVIRRKAPSILRLT